MNILSRFSDIMRSNINALLDKCEDPAKMADQILIDLRNDLAELKKETADVIAEEKSNLRKIEECTGEIKKFTEAAQNALKEGHEDDARKLITKKQQLEQTLASLQGTYDVAHQNAEKMRQMHNKLVDDIEALEARKSAIKAKVSTAKAQDRMNKVADGLSDGSEGIEAFERMEEKANKMLDSANASAELSEAVSSVGKLAEKYVSGGTASVEEELAKMKADLGL